jgi:uncharacterized membrane protein
MNESLANWKKNISLGKIAWRSRKKHFIISIITIYFICQQLAIILGCNNIQKIANNLASDSHI